MPRDLARLMESLLSSGMTSQRTAWSPPVDVYRTSEGWLVKFDLAGVRPADMQLLLSGPRLIVRGRRRDWVVDDMGSCSAYSMEITYSQFERTVELPVDLERMRLATDYRDGMLLVRLCAEEQPPA